MEIKPTYVSFEQASLLKEKGFDEITKSIYQYENLVVNNDYVNFRNSLFSYDHFEISAPEQWQVVEWLRINHGIFVWVAGYRDKSNRITFDFYFDKQKLNEKKSNFFKTPQEAYSAAFDYTFKRLI